MEILFDGQEKIAILPHKSKKTQPTEEHCKT